MFTPIVIPSHDSAKSIGKSLRFRPVATARLSKTFTRAAPQKFTISFWCKRGKLDSVNPLIYSRQTGVGAGGIYFDDQNRLFFGAGASSVVTTEKFLDPASWYHIVFSFDGSSGSTPKFYVNGVSVLFTGTLSGSLLFDPRMITSIGMYGDSSAVLYDGCISEVVCVDGQVLTPADFGGRSTQTGAWVPKRYMGSYGASGFHLEFNSGATVADLGKDSSPNHNDFGPHGFSLAEDWVNDSPTNNCAVLNPLKVPHSTLTNGNLTSTGTNDLPTILPDFGRWYFEIDGVGKQWTPPAAFPAAAGNYNFGQKAFSHAIPAGFKELRVSNLPSPAVINGGRYFDAKLRSGTGAGGSVTGIKFSPDFVWTKARDSVTSHILTNTARGATKYLSTDTTAAEKTDAQSVTAFTADGFSFGSNAEINATGKNFVDWMWKKGRNCGFDVVDFLNQNADHSVNHLLGANPAMIIVKGIGPTAKNWSVMHQGLANMSSAILNLNTADPTTTLAGPVPASTNTTFGSSGLLVPPNERAVAYLWSEISGFSKFGKYTGNGAVDGEFVYCGFRPRLIIIKRADSAASWFTYDAVRSTSNEAGLTLSPNLHDVEVSTGADPIDILSNGFKLRGVSNSNVASGNYIFAAFAETPFKFANAR